MSRLGHSEGMIVVKIRRTGMDDVLIIEPKVLGSSRWFTETYSRKTLEELGLSRLLFRITILFGK